MVESDPWKVNEINQIATTNVNDSEKNRIETPSNSFEDNFQPETVDKLPDSEEYLKILERKLTKLKGKSSFLNELKARREHCIELLLENKIDLREANDEETFVEEFEASTTRDIVRFLQPEQAIRSDELHHLVDHDQLSATTVQDEITEQPNEIENDSVNEVEAQQQKQ